MGRSELRELDEEMDGDEILQTYRGIEADPTIGIFLDFLSSQYDSNFHQHPRTTTELPKQQTSSPKVVSIPQQQQEEVGEKDKEMEQEEEEVEEEIEEESLNTPIMTRKLKRRMEEEEEEEMESETPLQPKKKKKNSSQEQQKASMSNSVKQLESPTTQRRKSQRNQGTKNVRRVEEDHTEIVRRSARVKTKAHHFNQTRLG